jgi:hypothetical protein
MFGVGTLRLKANVVACPQLADFVAKVFCTGDQKFSGL